MEDNPSPYFQDHMPGNICFGCGNDNQGGLHIKSYWDDQVAICHWLSEDKYRGWQNLMNGGILATLIDCHCMGTAMAAAYRDENRALDSQPIYRYATGTITVKYLKPTSNQEPVTLRAWVTEIKGRKTTLRCEVFSANVLTAEADVIAIRVVDSSSSPDNNPFAS